MHRHAPLRRAGWIGMAAAANLVALFSVRYFTLDPRTFIPGQGVVYLTHLGPLLLHVGGGVVALATGPWQLWTGLRRRRPRLHRWLGRVYVAAVAAAGAGGLLLAPLSMGGPMAHLGFGALAVALLATTATAFVMIRRRDVRAHRAWMVRSYALIFTAVTFRAWLVVLVTAGLPFVEVYATGSWTAWLINLFAAELLLGAATARQRSSPAAA